VTARAASIRSFERSRWRIRGYVFRMGSSTRTGWSGPVVTTVTSSRRIAGKRRHCPWTGEVCCGDLKKEGASLSRAHLRQARRSAQPTRQ